MDSSSRHSLGVAGLLRGIECIGIPATFAGADVGDLARADVGVQPFGMTARELHANVAAPGMAEQEDLLLAQVSAKERDHLLGVVDEALGLHRRRHGLGIIDQVGLAGAALVPVDHHEVFLQCERVAPREGRFDEARAAVKDQQHRITAVAAADGDELVDPTDANGFRALDAIRRHDTSKLADDRSGLGAIARSRAFRREDG